MWLGYFVAGSVVNVFRKKRSRSYQENVKENFKILIRWKVSQKVQDKQSEKTREVE